MIAAGTRVETSRFMLDSLGKSPQIIPRNGRVAQLAEQLTLNQ